MIETCNIDWVHALVTVQHDATQLSSGVVIHLNNELDYDSATHNYKPKIIRSSYDDTIWIKPHTTGSIEISGNFYKFLNHQNITGSNDLQSLVSDLIIHLQALDIGVNPSADDFLNIKQGNFRLFRVDVNTPLLFNTKQDAIVYLNRLKLDASYPYRQKVIYDNGVYFGMKSKRWILKFYHKSEEIRKHEKLDFKIDDDLKALADLMIRAEVSIKSKQLKEWDLIFGHQWDSETTKNLMSKTLDKMILPEEKRNIEMNEIKNTAHRRFYDSYKQGDMNNHYSPRTIQRYKKTFLKDYSININNAAKQEKE